jgi:hypothetical protein
MNRQKPGTHKEAPIMDDNHFAAEELMTPLDDMLSDLAGAVRSLSDSELRGLLVALLSEWRDRRSTSSVARTN